MCRLAAYIGPGISLQHFLLDPPHNLIRQSWNPKEMSEAVLNADGFGFGWYPDRDEPVTYLNTQPAWSDVNIAGLAVSLSSTVWMAYVRSATEGQITGLINTQPFTMNNILYIHNGNIKQFNPGYRIRFHEYLQPDTMAGINGNTDSEYLFAVIREQIANNKGDLEKGLGESLKAIQEIMQEGSCLLNCILTDGNTVFATRHAINGVCPSLYYLHDDSQYPDATLITSEPVTTSGKWEQVPEHSLLIASRDTTPEIRAIQ